DMRGHQDHENVGERAEPLDADAPTFQVGDRTDILAGEQFEATDIQTTEQGDCLAGIDLADQVGRVVCGEIGAAARYGGGECAYRRIDVANVSEPLLAQQFLGDVLRRVADARVLGEPDGGGFEGAFRGARGRRPDEADAGGRGNAADHLPPGLDQC